MVLAEGGKGLAKKFRLEPWSRSRKHRLSCTATRCCAWALS